MITDRIPRNKTDKEEYFLSDDMRAIDLPPARVLRELSKQLEEALATENKKELQAVSNELAEVIADQYQVDPPPVKVLGVRPRKVYEDYVNELYGDYDPSTEQIRLWMRTAVQKKATSFGTFLSTLIHEICHHLDIVLWDFPNSYHTRGFYERAGLLYHHTRGTPLRPLVWISQSDGRYRINWPATMRGGRVASARRRRR